MSVEDDTTCTVQVDELRLSGVRLRSVVNKEETGILITPKVGSYVLVTDLSGGNMRVLVVSMYSEVDKITINGGKNDGLININDLTDKLNKLVGEVNALKDKFNGHTHIVSGTINLVDSSCSGNAAAIATKASAATKFNKDDYEDTSIVH